MASVTNFYGRWNQHRFLSHAVNQIQDADSESDVVIIGPRSGGEDIDLESEDGKILNTTGLP